MDRGAWRATVHGVKRSWTRLSDSHTHTHSVIPLRILLTESKSVTLLKNIYIYICFHLLLNMLTSFAKGRGKTKSRDNRLPAHLGTRLDENRKGFTYSAISYQDHKPETILNFR